MRTRRLMCSGRSSASRAARSTSRGGSCKRRTIACGSLRARVIVKTNQGHQVQSEAGKPLSKPDLSKEQAEKRLQQVERFKHMDKWAARSKRR